jgi:hypothetical protein
MLIKRDELINTEDEIKILENLLQQAIWKRRIILKKREIQNWWDWLLEIIGY